VQSRGEGDADGESEPSPPAVSSPHSSHSNRRIVVRVAHCCQRQRANLPHNHVPHIPLEPIDHPSAADSPSDILQPRSKHRVPAMQMTQPVLRDHLSFGYREDTNHAVHRYCDNVIMNQLNVYAYVRLLTKLDDLLSCPVRQPGSDTPGRMEMTSSPTRPTPCPLQQIQAISRQSCLSVLKLMRAMYLTRQP